MIKTKTVLILGAGASAHLNLPIGTELITNIINDVEQRNGRCNKYLDALNYSQDQIKEFRAKLDGSAVPTIDSFLEHQPTYRPIAKVAIAAWLVELENASVLTQRNHNWYIPLFAAMNSDLDHFSDNQLSIITYNYDRSIDQFLYTAVENKYPVFPPIDKIAAFRSIQIIHLHGKLGTLPWEGNGSRRYGEAPNPEQMRAAADGIKIVHDADPESEEFKRAHYVLGEAKAVFFLGFGYDQANLGRLMLDKLDTSVQLYGTAYGCSEERRGTIKGLYPRLNFELAESKETIETFFPDRLDRQIVRPSWGILR